MLSDVSSGGNDEILNQVVFTISDFDKPSLKFQIVILIQRPAF